MIKINLLPVRAAKKKETAIQQIVIFCAAVILVLVVVISLYLFNQLQISSTRNNIVTANARINELKKKIGKIEELKSLKEQVKKKLDVLTQLRKNKTGPAQRLATLSTVTPDQLWLTGYSENGPDIRIAGMALNEDLIAIFMRALDASADYTGVELVVSEQSESAGTKFKRFEITCKLKAQTVPATPVK